MFKMCLFLWIKDQSLYPNQFIQHSFMVLCKQRQLWVKHHWEMLQFSFIKMKAFACFYGLWGFVSSVRILAGAAWASLPPCSLHARVYIEARWTCDSPAERVVLSSILWGALYMGTGWGELAGGPPDQRFSKGMASPQAHECQSGSPLLWSMETFRSWGT